MGQNTKNLHSSPVSRVSWKTICAELINWEISGSSLGQAPTCDVENPVAGQQQRGELRVVQRCRRMSFVFCSAPRPLPPRLFFSILYPSSISPLTCTVSVSFALVNTVKARREFSHHSLPPSFIWIQLSDCPVWLDCMMVYCLVSLFICQCNSAFSFLLPYIEVDIISLFSLACVLILVQIHPGNITGLVPWLLILHILPW